MKVSRLLGSAALVGLVAMLLLVPAAPSGTGKFLRAPVFAVGPSPVTEGVGEQLMESLSLQENPFSEQDGALRYMNPDLFLALPTSPLAIDTKPDEGQMEVTPEALDETAAPLIEPPRNNLALDQALAALSEAGLMDDLKPLGARASIGHARFQSIGTKAGPIDVPIDTEVIYRFRLNGRELLGPAAETRFSFAGGGEVSQLLINFPSVSKDDEVRIMTPQLAAQAARKQLAGACTKGPALQLSKGTLVYYAPTGAADTIFPWYRFDATIPGRFTARARTVLVPAVIDGALSTSMTLRFANGLVTAAAKPRGGTPPYSYQWSSCSTPIDPAAAGEQTISYQPTPRDGEEIVSLVVTDANGLTAQASGRLQPGATNFVRPRRSVQSIPRVDAGIEWIGTSGGLPGSAVSAGGFVTTMTAFGPVPIQFNWGDLAAWERDFKDPSKGGQDSSFVDDVDLTFYTGHAGDWGWWFSNTTHDDQWMTYADAFLGDRDLEWLGIAACGPLQATGSGLTWYQRWGPAFQGLHLLMGYATTSFDNTIEGPNFARYILGVPGLGWLGFGPVTVRQAWAQMAIDAQPSSVTWAEMGVYGVGGVSNWNDYFWGRGPTGPDIPQSQITGYWRLSGPS